MADIHNASIETKQFTKHQIREATNMRKVSNQNYHTSNPALMFAQGTEQLISEQMCRKPKYDDQELRAMQRSPKAPQAVGSYFSVLLQQLVWNDVKGHH